MLTAEWQQAAKAKLDIGRPTYEDLRAVLEERGDIYPTEEKGKQGRKGGKRWRRTERPDASDAPGEDSF